MQEQIQEEDDVTKDVISQYLPTRKRKPRAKKPNQASPSTSGNGESMNDPAGCPRDTTTETLGHVLGLTGRLLKCCEYSPCSGSQKAHAVLVGAAQETLNFRVCRMFSQGAETQSWESTVAAAARRLCLRNERQHTGGGGVY